MPKYLCHIYALFIFLFAPLTYAQHEGHLKDGELKHGRYIGHIKLNHTNEKVATVTDIYLESPDDLRQFPRLGALIKVSLGGYNTHEYITEIFENIRYDFDNGVLTLDDPKNDLLITAEVHSSDVNTFITGQVFVRSSAVSGTIEMQLETDEPGSDSEERPDADIPFIPLLEGQYEGKCEGDARAAMIQIQTVRGLKKPGQEPYEVNSLSKYYGIVARFAFNDPTACDDASGKPSWCTYNNYNEASYNFSLGKLVLQGNRSSNDCSLVRGKLSCKMHTIAGNTTCNFQKKNMIVKSTHFYARDFNLRATPEQMQDLPPASPPKNLELTKDLKGDFYGYLHNETNNSYQIFRLNVAPFSSTENPHNPNQMMVAATAISHMGSTPSSDYFTQRFEPRSFYLRPGFTLNGPNADSYINVSEWKRGFIRGTLYSHAFGKVGTIQLVKGSLPEAPKTVTMTRSFVGEFEGPISSADGLADGRWFNLLSPVQPSALKEHLVKVTGSSQSIVGVTGIQSIEKGTYDPYTGIFGWLVTRGDDSTMTSGYITEDGNAMLFWPPAPNVPGIKTSEFEFKPYRRLPTIK